jgi:phosphoribosylanthranilate isomerase
VPDLIKEYSQICDAVLLDSNWKGGSGIKHNWEISSKVVHDISCPIILAGGINIDNIIDAVRIVNPYAIDIQTGAEKALIVDSQIINAKSVLKVKDLIEQLKKYSWQ